MTLSVRFSSLGSMRCKDILLYLKRQSGFPSSLGKRLDTSMVQKTISVKHNLLDVFLKGNLGDSPAHSLCCLYIAAVRPGFHNAVINSSSGDDSRAVGVLNDLGVNVFGTPENTETRPV